MEKFALLDFLKAFQSLSSNAAAKPAENKPAAPPSTPQGAPWAVPSRDGSAQQPAPAASPSRPDTAPPSADPGDGYEVNVMANVIARHEEISNRIKNKR